MRSCGFKSHHPQDVYKRQVLDDFARMLSDIAVIEKPAKLEGRSMSIVLTEKR